MGKAYHGGEVMSMKDNLILTRPLNEWDMNYHLHDTVTGKEYLIDIDDIVESIEEADEIGGIPLSELLALDDIETIKEVVWKTL